MTIPIVVCIDVEPEAFFVDRVGGSPWHGTAQAFETIEGLRRQLSAPGHPARFTWCVRMDPQIELAYGRADRAISEAGAALERALAQGDEVGLHTHYYRWDDALADWVVDHGNPAWVEHCLRSSFAAYRAAFGRPCEVFRGGDRWHDDAAVALVQALGARYDLTVEQGGQPAATGHPGKPFTGSIPDYSRVPAVPYRPSSADFRRAAPGDGRDLWMIPLSGGTWVNPAWRRPWKHRLVDRIDPFKRIRVLHRRAPYTLRPAAAPGLFREQFENYRRERAFRYVALAIRTHSFAREGERANFVANLEYLAERLRADGGCFCTPATCIELLATFD